MGKNDTAKLLTKAGKKGDRGRTVAIQVLVAAILIGLIAAIGFSVKSKQDKKDQDSAAQAAVAAGPPVMTGGALRFGNPDAKVTVRIYEDFICPSCRAFESVAGQKLTDLINGNKVAVEYLPLGLLDQQTTTQYSSRAANASTCVAVADKAKWPAWHKTMFDRQPEEGGAGLTNDQLVDVAKQAGYTTPEVATCITSGQYLPFVQARTKKAIDDGINQTPTVEVNGSRVKSPTPDNLDKAIADAERK